MVRCYKTVERWPLKNLSSEMQYRSEEFETMGSLNKEAWVMGTLAMFSFLILVGGTTDCTTVTALLTTCSDFISFGTPDPVPGSRCCNALASLKNMAESTSNQGLLCRCFIGLLVRYNQNATAIATIPGFCGVSLGFTIDPNTNCNNVP